MRNRIPVRVSLALDPAVTDKKRSDFSGMTVVLTDLTDTWYIAEADNFKGQPAAVVDRFVMYARMYRPAAISIEANAAQILYKELLIPALRSYGINTPITEYRSPTTINKRAKIERLQPKFKKGQVFIKRGLVELVRQLDQFPELDHDDLLDSLVQHLTIARPPQPYEMTMALEEDTFDLEEDSGEGRHPTMSHVGLSAPHR